MNKKQCENEASENDISIIQTLKEEIEKVSKNNLRMYNKTLKLLRKLDRVGRSLN